MEDMGGYQMTPLVCYPKKALIDFVRLYYGGCSPPGAGALPAPEVSAGQQAQFSKIANGTLRTPPPEVDLRRGPLRR